MSIGKSVLITVSWLVLAFFAGFVAMIAFCWMDCGATKRTLDIIGIGTAAAVFVVGVAHELRIGSEAKHEETEV
jgi:hypothetical protein